MAGRTRPRRRAKILRRQGCCSAQKRAQRRSTAHPAQGGCRGILTWSIARKHTVPIGNAAKLRAMPTEDAEAAFEHSNTVTAASRLLSHDTKRHHPPQAHPCSLPEAISTHIRLSAPAAGGRHGAKSRTTRAQRRWWQELCAHPAGWTCPRAVCNWRRRFPAAAMRARVRSLTRMLP